MTHPLRTMAMLVVFIAVMAAVAITGAQFRPGPWYVSLAKPSWTPPNWLFGPVWGMLYFLIAIGGWLAWRDNGFGRPLLFWLAQAVLNACWSWLFFGKQQIGLALADIALLWLAIGGFIWSAWPVSPGAAALFVPYWAWVSFAAALNFAIWRLNS